MNNATVNICIQAFVFYPLNFVPAQAGVAQLVVGLSHGPKGYRLDP